MDTCNSHVSLYFRPLDGIVNCLIPLVTMNNGDGHFKCQNKSWDAEIMRGENEDPLFCLSNCSSPDCVS